MSDATPQDQDAVPAKKAPQLPPIDDTDYSDQRRPFISALKAGSTALVGVVVLSLVGWSVAAGWSGFWGVLVAGLIAGVFVLTTVLLTLASSNSGPAVTGALVLGGWLLKLVVFVIILWVLKGLTFYHPVAFFVTTVVTLLVMISTEVWAVLRTRMHTIDGSKL